MANNGSIHFKLVIGLYLNWFAPWVLRSHLTTFEIHGKSAARHKPTIICRDNLALIMIPLMDIPLSYTQTHWDMHTAAENNKQAFLQSLPPRVKCFRSPGVPTLSAGKLQKRTQLWIASFWHSGDNQANWCLCWALRNNPTQEESSLLQQRISFACFMTQYGLPSSPADSTDCSVSGEANKESVPVLPLDWQSPCFQSFSSWKLMLAHRV